MEGEAAAVSGGKTSPSSECPPLPVNGVSDQESQDVKVWILNQHFF